MGDRLLSQLRSFPAGKHDDAVDVFGLMGRVIDQAHPAFVEMTPKTEPADRYYKAFNKNKGESDWKTL